MIQTKAPGKLFLAGEYAVVEPGQPALIAAVSHYLYVTLTASTASCGAIISSQQPDFVLRWKRENNSIAVLEEMNPYALITTAMQISEQYVREQKKMTAGLYDLTITSELDDPHSKVKFGLGSSGAVVVATIEAVLTWHKVPFDALILYKLAAITQTLMGSNGSFGDVAASSFGGIIAYARADQSWLQTALRTMTLVQVISQKWPQLSITPITLPTPLRLLVGWTKSKADTSVYVSTVEQSRLEKEKFYSAFLAESAAIVHELTQACRTQQISTFHAGMAKNRALLQQLSTQTGVVIETPTLTTLCNIALASGASAKTSGAGGGDCGICFPETDFQEAAIRKQWEAAGIQPLPISIAPANQERKTT